MNSVNLTKTNQAFTKNSLGSIAAAKREQHLRSLYLQLTKEVILNNIYEPGPHIDEGRQWPPHKALTMIGRKRLDNVEELVERVLDQSIPGDLIETGVWRGGTTIFMRAILKAYDVHDRKVFVADSFRGIPPIDPQKYPADSAHKEWISLRFLVIIQLNASAKIFAGCNFSTTKWFFSKDGSRIHSLRYQPRDWIATPWTGLTVVTGLDPASMVLSER
jgi:hypothetical protein